MTDKQLDEVLEELGREHRAIDAPDSLQHVLYVAAERDMMVSKTSAHALFERAPEPKTLVTIDSDHTYAGENARAAVLGWLNERHPR